MSKPPKKIRMFQDKKHSEIKAMTNFSYVGKFPLNTLTLPYKKKGNGTKEYKGRLDNGNIELNIGNVRNCRYHLMLIDRMVVIRLNPSFDIEDQTLNIANKEVQLKGYKVLKRTNRGQITIARVNTDNSTFEMNHSLDGQEFEDLMCFLGIKDAKQLTRQIASFIRKEKCQMQLMMIKTGERHTQQLTKEKAKRKSIANKVKIK